MLHISKNRPRPWLTFEWKEHPHICPTLKTPTDAGNDQPRTEFAVGYEWANVRDEEEEGLSSIRLS